MDERVERFRGRDRHGACAGSLKAGALSYARERVALGESLEHVAKELQTKAVTLRRWMEGRSASAPFRAVEIVRPAEMKAPAERTEQANGVVLVTRQGHSVYGLEPATLAQVLIALG